MKEIRVPAIDSPLWWRVYTRTDHGDRGRQAAEDRRTGSSDGPLDQDDPLLRAARVAGAASSYGGRIPALRAGGRRPAPVRPAGEAAGLTLEEIKEPVRLAARCNEGEIVPRLEEVLEAKLEETQRKMAELAAFRQNLLYYQTRASALSDGVLPTDRYCEEVSFCGCLDAMIGEGGEKP